eukprot:CAMPEP_0201921192 /NCGR_PEP_ID=MMETSP0903-20130614/9595_1 /ASSEMBLY_ACC=CAM_ASM_000552 /TAXON_ID=420261 /ORGANISM="Thalassiosira antarctica, Strain CCMP982" /LENGTH=70 /DNA_ID=CAMNT_0048458107 /DNA_START=211 /DNA_END=420 /DNA_ORIENTATION=+
MELNINIIMTCLLEMAPQAMLILPSKRPLLRWRMYDGYMVDDGCCAHIPLHKLPLASSPFLHFPLGIMLH